ncbi:uncharacterized protein YjbI with pentapeptide repeats [Winogradskyella epiphytica]|uniref:Uncharacterized protein YjbI with pentapeptide repeats n=1 Tax=Winogradskyella epiphytica TaxID=262005 RepID=A0A2V4XSU8_9FLAO|nr:pentapeptide repeat-containing protein [Winogradskyella epiphytica]PYE81431.1 uncharacterized protein YjbI with pentapeptide repeats [Winogradskyella epiphytica]GGW65163.1 hypothetical protein GCM10008085_16620 [Winogradskyella epiphytica]
MILPVIDNQTFSKQDYAKDDLLKAEYEDCTFINCDFNNSDLTSVAFLTCEFIDCNFSNANITQTTFNNVNFKGCKLLGVKFHRCNEFLLSFSCSDCLINFSSFYKVKLNQTKFYKCILHQVDFTDAQAKHAIFDDCDLSQSIFYNTNLEHADLSSAYNFSIDPSLNQIKNAYFSKSNLIGLLNAFKIRVKD